MQRLRGVAEDDPAQSARLRRELQRQRKGVALADRGEAADAIAEGGFGEARKPVPRNLSTAATRSTRPRVSRSVPGRCGCASRLRAASATEALSSSSLSFPPKRAVKPPTRRFLSAPSRRISLRQVFTVIRYSQVENDDRPSNRRS